MPTATPEPPPSPRAPDLEPHCGSWVIVQRITRQPVREVWSRAVADRVAPALAEYGRARSAAWAEYERARAPALAEYERARSAAWGTAYCNDTGVAAP